MIRILIRQQDSRLGPRSRLLANIFLLAIKASLIVNSEIPYVAGVRFHSSSIH
jgi:hypothetical protein